MLFNVSHRNRLALFPPAKSVKKTDDHQGKARRGTGQPVKKDLRKQSLRGREVQIVKLSDETKQ
jgi:hypothetical protein